MGPIDDKIARLKAAFAADGFRTDDEHVVLYKGKVGMAAAHATAVNYQTGQPKKAYYVEGDPYTLGYLLGRLAEPETARMATEFVEKIVIDMIDPGLPAVLKEILGRIIADLVWLLARKMKKDIPKAYRREMKGLLDGCRAARPETKANKKGIWILNTGVDCLLSIIYRLDLFASDIVRKVTAELRQRKGHPALSGIDHHVARVKKLEPGLFRVPFFCNGFSACRSAASGNHYLGRDFMFATAGVFQDTAAMTVYNPDPPPGGTARPFISMAAPGMLGSVAALNRSNAGSGGVGGGMDMSAAGNCAPDRPGLNSLLLIRSAVEQADDTDGALAVITRAQRGVSWLYLLADGVTDKACVVEAGRSEAVTDPLSYPPAHLKRDLPDAAYLRAHPTAAVTNGVAARFADYRYQDCYVKDFNTELFRQHGKTIQPGAFDRTGFIDATWTDRNCPQSYYFAPQRETNPDIVLAGNHCVTPEMRLCAMHPWTNLVFAGHCDDIQWRYDALNALLCKATDNGKTISHAKAREIIDFLRPYDVDHKPGPYAEYYANSPKSQDGKETMIAGCVCLLDLKNNTMESHYGYYGDEWVRISLNGYLEDV